MRMRLAPRAEGKARCVSRRARPQLELLESRLAPATITVTTKADDLTPNDGSVSLREAITALNAGNDLGDPDITAQNPGTFGTNDTINFNIPGTSPFQINVGGSASAPSIPLPNIVKPMQIDGTTQSGLSGPPLVVVNGSSAGANANGLDVQLGAQVFSSGVTIKGLVINDFSGNGIVVGPNNVTGLSLNPVVITGNYIGTNASGAAAAANQQSGILIDATNSNNIGLSASNNLVTSNVISGNALDGVRITASNGVAAGNTLDLKEAKIPRFLSGGARVSDARTLFACCFGEEQYGRILYDLCMCHHAFCRVASVAAADRDIRIPTSKGHLLNNAMPLPAARRCAAGDSRTTTDTPAYGWSAQFDTAAARTPVRTT